MVPLPLPLVAHCPCSAKKHVKTGQRIAPGVRQLAQPHGTHRRVRDWSPRGGRASRSRFHRRRVQHDAGSTGVELVPGRLLLLAGRAEGMRAKAIIEVVAVFAVTLGMIGLLFISPLGRWERMVLPRVFLSYALMIATPLLILTAMRRNANGYGLTLMNLRYHLNIAFICLIPYSAAKALQSGVKLGNGNSNQLFDGVVAVATLLVIGRIVSHSQPSQQYAGAVDLNWLGFTSFSWGSVFGIVRKKRAASLHLQFCTGCLRGWLGRF